MRLEPAPARPLRSMSSPHGPSVRAARGAGGRPFPRDPRLMYDFDSLQPPADWELPAATVEELRPTSHEYAVVIPVLNEGERIKRQLAVMHQAADPPDVIICDGGSDDGCTETELMRELGVTCIIRKTGPGRIERPVAAPPGLRDAEGISRGGPHGRQRERRPRLHPAIHPRPRGGVRLRRRVALPQGRAVDQRPAIPRAGHPVDPRRP